jgi:glycerol-3-phosphate dehydrogenase
MYSSNTPRVLELYMAHREEAARHGMPAAWFAALLYAIEEEMAAVPADFFIRRTGALYFDVAAVKQWKQPVADYMTQRFSWSEAEAARHMETLNRHIQEATEPSMV